MVRKAIAMQFPEAREVQEYGSTSFTIEDQRQGWPSKGAKLFSFTNGADIIESEGGIYLRAYLASGSFVSLHDRSGLTRNLIVSQNEEKRSKEYAVVFTLTDLLNPTLSLVPTLSKPDEEGDRVGEISIESDSFPILTGKLIFITATDPKFAGEIQTQTTAGGSPHEHQTGASEPFNTPPGSERGRAR